MSATAMADRTDRAAPPPQSGKGPRRSTGAAVPPGAAADRDYRTNVRLRVGLADALWRIAQLEQRSMNSQIEYALERYVRDYEREHGPLPTEPRP
jgi:hypothetical protein